MNTNKWDKRFMELAKLISTWSKDPSTKAGSVIISPERTILSVGYNGFPKLLDDNVKLYDNRETKYSRIIHAEMNAILNSKQIVTGGTLYTFPLGPCDRCVVHFIQAGIKRFVFPKLSPELKTRWHGSIQTSKRYIKEAKLTYKEI